MKICLYTDTALPTIGGQEVAVDALARQFQQLGHEVRVLAPLPSKFWRVRDWRLPYPVVRHPRFVSSKKFVEWYRYALLRQDRRQRFEMIHAHGVYHAGYVASLCQPQLAAPLTITSHGGDVNPHNHRLQDLTLRKRHTQALRAAKGLVAISPATREGYLALDSSLSSKIVDICNGTDTATLAVPIRRPPRLNPRIEPGQYGLFLGRLTHQKGADVLPHALARLPDNGKLQLVIAGDGPVGSELEQLAGELNLTHRVFFPGIVAGTVKTYLLQNAHFCVLPSRSFEGLGLVTLDSFAAGHPVIASNLAGPATVVRPGVTGELVAEESPTELAAALQRFFEDRDYVAQLGKQAQQFVQAYSWRSIAVQHLELYLKLLAQSPSMRKAA